MDDPIARVATGVAEGTDIYVATLHEDGRSIAYFCGGPTTFQSHTRWFTGAPGDDGAFEHTLGDWRVQGVATADGATGTLTDDTGEQFPFTTQSTAGAEVAGLYRGQLDGCTVGVVVLDDSGVDAMQGTFFCEGAEAAAVQVIILSPSLTDDGGLEVQVQQQGAAETDTVQVMPV